MDDDHIEICERCGAEMEYLDDEVVDEGLRVAVWGCPKCEHRQAGRR